jgi:hypothetical protein
MTPPAHGAWFWLHPTPDQPCVRIGDGLPPFLEETRHLQLCSKENRKLNAELLQALSPRAGTLACLSRSGAKGPWPQEPNDETFGSVCCAGAAGSRRCSCAGLCRRTRTALRCSSADLFAPAGRRGTARGGATARSRIRLRRSSGVRRRHRRERPHGTRMHDQAGRLSLVLDALAATTAIGLRFENEDPACRCKRGGVRYGPLVRCRSTGDGLHSKPPPRAVL